MKIPEKVWLWLFGSLGVAMAAFTFFGEKGHREVYRLNNEREKLSTEISELWTRKRSAEKEIENLRNNPAAIEDRARRELGMIRRGETVFHLSGADEARK